MGSILGQFDKDLIGHDDYLGETFVDVDAPLDADRKRFFQNVYPLFVGYLSYRRCLF